MPEQPSDISGPLPSFKQEQQFHADKWERQAQDYYKNTWVGKYWKRKTAEDFMREEAELDNEDFDKRNHEEFEQWQERLKVVVESFLEKAKSPESKKRTLLYVMGGAMRTPLSAGQLIGLNMVGVTGDTIDVVAGSSGGACGLTYYLAGEESTRAGTKMMTDDMADKRFLNTSDPFRSEGMVNLGLMAHWMREGTENDKGMILDQKAVKRSKAKLWYTVTHPVVGREEPRVEFLDAKKLPDMVDGIVASMTIPGFTGKIPEIEGVKYYDGGFASLPLDQVIKKFTEEQGAPPTDVLILPTMPFDLLGNIKVAPATIKVAEMFQNQGENLEPIAKASAASASQFRAALLLKEKFRMALIKLKKMEDINVAVMWPPAANVEGFAIDSGNMKTAVINSIRDTIKQFGGEQPEVLPLYNSIDGQADEGDGLLKKVA